ncbi:alpha/beta fold hydrolase [Alkalihalobacillus trypoxylicola]|uniref:Alpha/beta hydrolase n=1 Tax=Alkalihalobacillus trypoxylicola TaxID=519424 RepID=A0A161PFM5_9BACI|nr:alpha/beta hydrolase [Alkalihalobacillus trypoxylicola]KYG31947.1 alpha/beta hydrolase [Alkalihalobacillus trypoxylicola]
MSRSPCILFQEKQYFVKIVGKDHQKPTIVMEAGYGDDSSTWDLILEEISQTSKVMVYDRAGLGGSKRLSSLRTSEEMVKELYSLLKHLELDPPYLLVGHSFGGLNMRLFATKYESLVCGLLLIDSTPEEYIERFLPIMPESFQRAYYKQFTHEGNTEDFMESLKQVKLSKRRLCIPMIVLSAGKKMHYSKEAQQLWHKLQKETLNLSNNGKYQIIQDSGHYIHHDRPDIIIQSIKKLIDNSL